jgi:hypothetical protein
MRMAGALMHKGAAPRSVQAAPLSADGYPGEKQYSLSEFLSSISGIVEGHTFTRRDVIKYIANVKGGVHLSAKQKRSEERLVARMRKMEKKVTFHTTDGLFVELVAIGQALGRSADAKHYIEAVREP